MKKMKVIKIVGIVLSFFCATAFAGFYLQTNPWSWVTETLGLYQDRGKAELNSLNLETASKTAKEVVNTLRKSDLNFCNQDPRAWYAVVTLGGCYLNPDTMSPDRVRILEECFKLLPAVVGELADDSCKTRLLRDSEAILNYLVVAQFDEKFDSAFEEDALSSHQSKLDAMSTHLKWMSDWKQTGFPSSEREDYTSDLFTEWSKKLARISLRENSFPNSFEKKIELGKKMIDLAQQSQESLHSEFTARILLAVVNLLDERVILWQRIHDMSCQFLSCGPQDDFNTDLASIIWAFGHLTESSVVPPHWISDASDSVVSLVNSLTHKSPIYDNLCDYTRRKSYDRLGPSSHTNNCLIEDLSNFSSNWIVLQTKVEKYRQMSDLFELKGFFQYPTQTLVSGLTDESIRRSTELFREKLEAFDRLKEKTSSSQAEFLNSLNSQANRKEKVQQLEDEIKRKGKELGHILDQIHGTQKSIQLTEQNLAGRASGLLEELNQTRFKEQFDEQPSKDHLVISPLHVPQGHQFFVPAYKYDVKKGSLIQMTVTQDWAPSCAVRKEYGNKAGGKTGPEGYSLSVVEGSNRVVQTERFRSESQYESSDNTRTVCQGWTQTSGGAGGLFGGLVKAVGSAIAVAAAPATGGASLAVAAYMGAVGAVTDHAISGEKKDTKSDQTCRSTSKGQRKDSGTRESESTSKNSSIQASFNLGLKSDFAPLPNYPAGSLLMAYEFEQGGELKHLFQVVQRNHRFVVPEAGTIRFIVNDCSGPVDDDAGELAIDFKILEPKSQKVKRLITALNDVLGKLREKIPTYIARGDIGPEQWNEIRSGIQEELARSTRDQNDGVPEDIEREFSSFLYHWIDMEISQASSRLRIFKLMKEGGLVADQIGDLESTLERERLNQTLFDAPVYWAGLNYDLSHQSEIQAIREFLNLFEERISPIVRILYPNLYSDLKKHLENQKVDQVFQRLNVSSEEVSITTYLRTLGAAILDNMNLNKNDELRDPHMVLLKFPRLDADLDFRQEPLGDYDSRKYIWDDILGVSNQGGSIRVTPSSIYRKESQVSYFNLENDLVAPVVQSMGLVFHLDEEISVENRFLTGYQLNVDVPQTQLFTLPGGIYSFIQQSQNLKKVAMPIFHINHPNSFVELRRYWLGDEIAVGRGRGLSPFGEFKFESKELQRLAMAVSEGRLDRIKEVYWVMLIKATQTGKPVYWHNLNELK